MIAAGVVVRRVRRPSSLASFSGGGTLRSFSSPPGVRPTPLACPLDDRRAGRRRPQPPRHRHSRSWLSSSPSPPVEVTVTPSGADSEGSDSDGAPLPPGGGSGGEGGGGPAGSSSREAEEALLTLQSELRAHHRRADYASALSVASDLLDKTVELYGSSHPATASAHNNLGLMHKMLGRYDDARESYHDALRIYGEVVGKDRASYAAALSNLGMLERGRAMEAEAAEGEEDGQAEGRENEDDLDLEELRDSNASSPNSRAMSALDRIRSQLGSALAAAVLAERRSRVGGLVEAELRKVKRSEEVRDSKEMEAYVPRAVARAATMGGSRLTKRRMDVAEEHLRGALRLAVERPRGESVGPLEYVPAGDDDAVAAGGHAKVAVQGVAGKVTTLSAATAAQNLAVFLKNYSDWLRLSTDDDNGSPQSESQVPPIEELRRTMQEARHLYEAALHVRSALLPPHHPEVVATKFSLAELLDSPKVVPSRPTAKGEGAEAVDPARANALREEILKTYNVEEREGAVEL
ncbi:hypothetical protein ACHAWF_011696 [Thalassiosira exigua]